MRRRARAPLDLGRTLFTRLLATHLFAVAGASLIAILVVRRVIQGPVVVILAFAFLGVIVLGLATRITRSVTIPLDRIRAEVERAGDALPRIDTTDDRGSSALVGAVNRLASDLAERVEELRTETALREQILSSMEEGVLLAEGTTVIYANPAARELFGARATGAVPAGIPVPADGAPATNEITFHHPHYREIRCASTRIAHGKTLIVAQDVTAAKRTERIRRDFVANASHELKTPVAGILASAETLQDALEDDPMMARRSAEAIHKEAARLSNLVQDLLNLSRVEQTMRLPDPVDLGATVAKVVGELRPVAEAGSLDLTAAIDHDVRVGGGEEDLSLMIRNVLDNAIRYTPAGGSVHVELKRVQSGCILRVSDDGVGISARDLPRIFERFYRVDRARSRETGGTGLGLSIVRHVAETHGGSVRAESELGRGSTFTVTLPLTEA